MILLKIHLLIPWKLVTLQLLTGRILQYDIINNITNNTWGKHRWPISGLVQTGPLVFLFNL